ncbi:ABC transporter G family member 34-like isoform X1 [Chenopodium quinoa]|uniref:ABC transporter G family member 34-like isoform X1 n=2 Tax=Chenopodium quinoa TaxID=63459 RepID=UPI000B7810A2|nr:ABC transporter G family member 34-like isoform X1 [Chenopodium quinoa]
MRVTHPDSMNDTTEKEAGAVEEEVERRWAALQRLPTYTSIRKGLLRLVIDDGKVDIKEIDLQKLGKQEKKVLIESLLKGIQEDTENFLRKLRDRIDRAAIKIPNIQLRYEHLSVEGEVRVGSRALPTLLNSSMNFLETILGLIRLTPSKKRTIKILQDVSGIVKPSRMTLLLGPPDSGKTTLLQALAGKLDEDLKVTGMITYNGHELTEINPHRTSAYISQHDLHFGEMTVRETLDFSGRCLGVGTRYKLLEELLRQEKQSGITPDLDIDVFMKAIAIPGQESGLITDYVLKLLGLDICADTMVGDEMRRGISGGEKKRLTLGEMLVGPTKVFLMDEISTGLDSSTTFRICKNLRDIVHMLDVTMIISLLQPNPETYDLFDDIILLIEGHIVYQGSCEDVLEFFDYMGFKCPERKEVVDFLLEVTSKKDQAQYWSPKNQSSHKFISAHEFAQAFKSFRIGQRLASELCIPYDSKSKAMQSDLSKELYGTSSWKLLKACFAREWTLMKRNSFVYVFKTTQLTIMSLITMTVFLRTTMHHETVADGGKYLGALFFSLMNMMFNGMAEFPMTVLSLSVFYKQRDLFFYPAWAYALPVCVLRIPLSFVDSTIWTVITYYTIGFAPAISRFFCHWLALFCTNLMAMSLFRLLGAVGRTMVIASTICTLTLLSVFVLGGFIIAKDDIAPWMKWAYYLSPMMYGQNAIVINEFLDKRWSTPNMDSRINEQTIGKVILSSRGFFKQQYWFWICIGALLGFFLIFNLFYILSLTYLNPISHSRTIPLDDDDEVQKKVTLVKSNSSSFVNGASKRGMVLHFQPLSLTFNHVNYYVDTSAEMKGKGYNEDRLQLLNDVSGAFRPGIMTALVGVSGAGKTTLMDVLAGRKTGGHIEGSIKISGYPKNQATFARISGYCEQNDIHSPHVTVYESLLYSGWLRLSAEVDTTARKLFVDEVMDLVELKPLKDALVGLPGVNGLLIEQRKRLTVAVELVANPSIIFMDEPTSGLDARAAAIVMRTVRNTVDTGRTVVCTIHQPSINIFEAFDELLLMKRGGHIIYAGPLGHNSCELIKYFEAIPGVPKIKDGYNPATWVLDITSPEVESQLEVDFANNYANSSLYQRNQELIRELITPAPNSNDLHFPTEYSQPYLVQFKACFWKQYWSYWRNSEYNLARFAMTIFIGLVFGVLFWNQGGKISKEQDLMNLLGAMYSAVLFLGGTNTSAVQAVVATERTIFYREKAARMYSALPYTFAQVAIEAIYNVIQTLVYTLILYCMIGFEWNIEKFLYFYFFILMCFLYFTLYGMMLVSLSPGHQISAIIMNFFLGFWNIFAGFLIPRPQIPIWWRWFYWASPVSLTLYGLVTSQVGDIESTLLVPGGSNNISVKVFLKEYFGYDYEFLPYIVVAHLGWVLFFVFGFAYGMNFMNFQKR